MKVCNREFSRVVTDHVRPCHVLFMPVLAHHAWATRLVRYTAISESRAAGNLRVRYLNYRCKSVFRRDRSSESTTSTMSTRVTSGVCAYGYVRLLPTKMAPWQQLLHARDVK